MALRRPPTTFSDSIDAADLAANSVTSSELADNAVDAAAIAANAVTTAKIADSSSTTTGITPAKIAENAVTSAKIATGAVIADGIGAGAVVAAGLGAGAVTSAKIANDTIEVKPHIKHGWLYPALKDTGGAVRQTDGVTAVVASTVGPAGSAIASSLYGTVQSDGKMYYYTDIKGSKPIKDPRIGAHFGGQRHLVKSRQLLEQETASHGSDIYSADGREWIRMIWSNTAEFNASMGHMWRMTGTTESIEVVGYFTSINILTKAEDGANRSMYKVDLNGSVVSALTDSSNPTTIFTPLTDRYVSASAVRHFDVGATLGINTVRLYNNGSSMCHFEGVELIAQDKFTDATCDTTNTDATVTMDSTAKLSVGLSVTGTGVPAGAS